MPAAPVVVDHPFPSDYEFGLTAQLKPFQFFPG